jgi:hypothetical protein
VFTCREGDEESRDAGIITSRLCHFPKKKEKESVCVHSLSSSPIVISDRSVGSHVAQRRGRGEDGERTTRQRRRQRMMTKEGH